MCGGSKPSVVKTDPVADNDKIAAQAAVAAAADAATRKKSRRASALTVGAGTTTGGASGDSVLAYGKTTLGS
jgi:hypothetical protein